MIFPEQIEIKNLSKTYKTFSGSVQALRNVSFTIPAGSCTVIGGENGSGKSVLVSIISGLEDADAGRILYGEKPISTVGKRSLNPCGLVFQEAEIQILGETPREDIEFGPKNLKFSKDEIKKAVENALEKTGLTQKADFPARFLSGGEKRRLAVACMIAMEKPVIILDEPFANLDYSGVRQVNKLVRDLKEQGRTVMIVTHEIEKCLALADKFCVLFRGNLVFDGKPEEGIKLPLENWNIKNPLSSYQKLEDLVW